MTNRFYRNTFRALRLQVKSGFREEPPEFTIMKRYPPMFRNRAPSRTEVPRHKIPYLKLYQKAVERNPLFADERVFPAYWMYEPSALTLARKQYEHMKNGMDEETAYKKAVEYVDDIENSAYESLIEFKKLVDSADASKPYLSDPAIVEEIAYWKNQLETTKYQEMEPADQGDIDRFIQMSLLKWNEVERERRMRDPMFYNQFERVRESIFPEIVKAKEELFNFNDFKQNVNDYHRYMAREEFNTAKWCASKPFFYEDYAEYFEKVKKNPKISTWEPEEVQAFSHWVADTLAMQLNIAEGDITDVDDYIQLLQEQFFPMLRNPDAKREFELPDELSFRTKLYEENIGYKREEGGKLYVRRFYRIPALFFPESEEEEVQRFMDKYSKDMDAEPSAAEDGKGEPSATESAQNSSNSVAATAAAAIDQQSLRDLHKKYGLKSSDAESDTQSISHRLFDAIGAKTADSFRKPSEEPTPPVIAAYDEIEEPKLVEAPKMKSPSLHDRLVYLYSRKKRRTTFNSYIYINISDEQRGADFERSAP